MLEEIGARPGWTSESVSQPSSGIGRGMGPIGSGPSGAQPRGPMDVYVAPKPRQSTLSSKWKLEESREVCRKIG